MVQDTNDSRLRYRVRAPARSVDSRPRAAADHEQRLASWRERQPVSLLTQGCVTV